MQLGKPHGEVLHITFYNWESYPSYAEIAWNIYGLSFNSFKSKYLASSSADIAPGRSCDEHITIAILGSWIRAKETSLSQN